MTNLKESVKLCKIEEICNGFKMFWIIETVNMIRRNLFFKILFKIGSICSISRVSSFCPAILSPAK